MQQRLTCPYTLMGSGCRAALRLLRSGFSSARLAPLASPRSHSRSSPGSPRTTRKPRSWGKGARPPCSVCVQTSQRAPGGSNTTRVNRKGSRDSLLLLRVAMFGRTLPQVAPPPGENVQRAAGRAPGPGPRARRSRGSRPPAPLRAAAARSRSARRRHVCGWPRVPFAHFLLSRPLPRPGWGSQGSRPPADQPAVARPLPRRRVHTLGDPPTPVDKTGAGVHSLSLELVALFAGSCRGRPEPGLPWPHSSFQAAQPPCLCAPGPPPQALALSPPSPHIPNRISSPKRHTTIRKSSDRNLSRCETHRVLTTPGTKTYLK